ncbi:MAG: HAMP domain-containing histidine kinase [Chloroflexota bacterium]|nr:HAMP domain-containing histidine kinase [Chloroflexota bacterium]
MRSLRLRLPLLAMVVLAASLAVSALVSFQLLQFVRLADLDDALDREERRFQQSVSNIARQRADAAGGDITVDLVREAVQEYIALNPTNERYLIQIRIDPITYAAEGGPDVLERLRARGELPQGTGGRESLDSPLGQVRSLSAPVRLFGQDIGRFQVVGPLQPILDENLRSLAPLALASILSLLVGGALVAVALYRGLTPLQELAGTARTLDARDLSTRVREPERLDEVGVLAREFNSMLGRLEREAESRRGFLAAASHELRTPITIARGHIEILERQAGRDPEAATETARVVREELQRIGRLVDDLLAVARSEGEDFVVPRSIDLGRFFEDLRLRLTGLGVDGVELKPAPSGHLLADPNRLAQALLNLVVNASVHTPPGTRIEVGARRTPRGLAFFVRDDGPGMPPDLRERAFEPFVTGRSDGHDSSGLGLAVVAAIVAAHDGDLDLDSGPAGTTITLEFPDGTAAPGDETRPYRSASVD